MSAQAGWYDDGSGRQRWWDGAQWTEHYLDEQASQEVVEQPILAFASLVSGVQAHVSIYGDRIELVNTSGGVSAGKVTAGILTMGLSLAATGVGKDGYRAAKSNDVSILRMTDVTGITSRKEGKIVVVGVSTPSAVIAMNLQKKDAEQVVRTLDSLVTNAKAAAAAAAVPAMNIQLNTQAAATPAVSSATVDDTSSQLIRLAELHAQGVLSAEEFTAAKARVLGI